MTETTALAHRPTWSDIQRIGEDFYKSGMFSDVKNAMQAIVKIQAGNELGLPPFASISGINIIQGKAVLGANLIATLIKNDHRYDYRILKSTDEICEIKFYENGEEIGTSSFTIKEAQTAGLTGKDNWKKYTSDMLFARAISRGSRRHTPGIFGGAPVYTPDELGADTDPDGYVDTTFVNEQHQHHTKTGEVIEEPQKMSVETAGNVTRKDGKKYIDCTSAELIEMQSAIKASLDKNGLSEEQKTDHLYKLDAIDTLLSARKAATQEQLI